MQFKKILICFLTSVSLLNPCFVHGQALFCSDVLVDAKESKFVHRLNLNSLTRDLLATEYSRFQTWSDRAVIKVMQNSIRKKIMESCSGGSCTEQDVARIIGSSIVESFEKYDKLKTDLKKIRGYALLVGTSIGVAISSFYIKGMLPVDDKWITDFITIASSIVLYKLGAPLLDYYGGVMFRGAFRLEKGKSFLREASETVQYDKKYRNLQEKMTPWEQQETTRILTLLNFTEATFIGAIESIQSKDLSKGGFERASSRIALTAIKIRKFFPEIPAEDPDLIIAINMVFTQYLPVDGTRETLFKLIIQQIEANDPAFHDIKTSDFYKKSIRLWVGLE